MSSIRKEKRAVREGRILRERRNELGFTQMQVAMMSRVEFQQYQRFEYGKRSMATGRMEIGLRICAVLELDPYDLLSIDNE